jgi:dTDP-4-dehydrorhamnose 3,5-epimerase-like enzyme
MRYNKIELHEIGCNRGKLIAFEHGRNIPFVPQRTYIIYGTQQDVTRGLHAHRDLKQLLVCVSGSCKIKVDDGAYQTVFELSIPKQGLYLEGLIWRELFDFSPNCVLMVLADKGYDPSDYIYDYSEFLSLVGDKMAAV